MRVPEPRIGKWFLTLLISILFIGLPVASLVYMADGDCPVWLNALLNILLSHLILWAIARMFE